MTDAPPWQAIDLPALVMQPLDVPLAERFEPLAADEAISVDQLAIEMVEAQRAMPVTTGGVASAGAETVGVFVQLTEISRSAITSRIVHRWPEDLSGREKPGQDARHEVGR